MVYGIIMTTGGNNMEFKKLKSSSLRELFVKEIESMILSKELEIGQRLPTERELARMMNVSRAVVNGGLTELAKRGLVEIVPRRGAFVADYKSRGRIETLISILEYNGGRFEPEMLDALLEVRCCIESRVAYLAAQHATREQITELDAQLDTIARQPDPAALSRETFKFYHMLSIVSGNGIYPLLVYTFEPIYRPQFEAFYNIGQVEQRLVRMRDLVDAIRRRDPEAAADSIEDIITWGRELLGVNFAPGEVYQVGHL